MELIQTFYDIVSAIIMPSVINIPHRYREYTLNIGIGYIKQKVIEPMVCIY